MNVNVPEGSANEAFVKYGALPPLIAMLSPLTMERSEQIKKSSFALMHLSSNAQVAEHIVNIGGLQALRQVAQSPYCSTYVDLALDNVDKSSRSLDLEEAVLETMVSKRGKVGWCFRVKGRRYSWKLGLLVKVYCLTT